MRKRVWLVATVMLAGCAGSQPVSDEGPYPTPLTIEYRSLSKDRRYVYYRLDADGMLNFGGGRDAGIREASPAGKLTDAQRAELWHIIQQHQLMSATGSGAFSDYEKARYEVKLRAGTQQNAFNAVDDQVPGLKALDEALFNMQAAMRYDTVFQAIDEKINKSGGAVKKR
ncbi:hypothetical protein HED60_20180 [Planctomycetales bacterium ZRK34]|nr:hypothetical protein HED60_20180 [Planctomycetales bacterium ZRK34]